MANAQEPVHLTSEQDHQRVMNELHITSLRRGPDGDPKSPNAANVDESKVPPYTLPDPLILKNGTPVKDAATWWKNRRPEIVEDFDREVYGRVPKKTPKVRWEVISKTRETKGGTEAITKKLVGHVDNSSYPQISVNIEMTLSTPANVSGPVPVIIEFGLSEQQLASIKKRFTEDQWKALAGAGPTWQEQLLAKGWGCATLIPTSVQADNGEGLTEGIIGLVNKGQPRRLDDWGSLQAWAWGASRALDYLETDKAVDAKRVGIEGLSRYGKAALVAMAYEPRFAIGFIASSGEGGAKIMRRKFGEQVENVAGVTEYHWMAGNFLKYAGPLTPDDLPVDAHELIALCAPRPVFISSGSLEIEGGWIDGEGMFLGGVGAGPVYKLLGKQDLGTTELPPQETALIGGDLAFRQHSGGHTAGPNWPTFIAFASRYFNPPSKPQIALTFDDLPAHGMLPPGMSRVDVANSIIRALKSAHTPPVYGFVNAKRMEKEPESEKVLQLWRDAGLPLANHSFSHMDLDKNSAEDFEQDVLANETLLKKYMPGEDAAWHWLRYPYLNEGDTSEKHHAVLDFLKQRSYQVAQVTASFGDYGFNEPYVRCLAKNDKAGIEQLKKYYLEGAVASLTEAQKVATLIYGRDIKHVLLLHIGSFETVMFPSLLELLKERGFQIISLEEAQSDPAYAILPDLPAKWDGTLLEQMMATKHIVDAAHAEDRLALVDKVCR
jgi:peptidoglycan/xylan/chitin deacetylase (PgdA/CDA1 family)